MLMKMRSKMQNQKGFTLVELMVVVVILGILVAIAVPIYNNVTADAQDKACDATVRTLNGASSMYKAQTGAFPVNMEALVPNYIQATPVCPTAGVYSMDANGAWHCATHSPGPVAP